MHALVRASAALFATAACAVAPSPVVRDSAQPTVAAASPEPPAPTTPPSDSVSPVTDPARSSFIRILTQRNSGFDEAAELVIGDRAALESAWARLFNQVQGNPAPAVDFTRETVILVALGTRTSGGNTVQVDAVSRSGEAAVVRYTAASPAPGCMATQSLTSPVDVVRTPRLTGSIRFQRHDAVQPC